LEPSISRISTDNKIGRGLVTAVVKLSKCRVLGLNLMMLPFRL